MLQQNKQNLPMIQFMPGLPGHRRPFKLLMYFQTTLKFKGMLVLYQIYLKS